jgi:hypothetical protein
LLGENAPEARSIYAMARKVAAQIAEIGGKSSGPRVEID